MTAAELRLRRLAAENRALRRRVKRLEAGRRFEFSKAIFVGVSAVTLAVTIYSCVLSWIIRDASVLCYLIPAVFGEMASATAFYYNKAKAENQIKLPALYGANSETHHSNEIGG